MLSEPNTKLRVRLVLLCFAALLLGAGVWFIGALSPAGSGKSIFRIAEGQGFKDIANNLETDGFARSSLAAKIYLLVSGKAFHLQPGAYLLDKSAGFPSIAGTLGSGEQQAVRTVIPEGSSIYDIDAILSENYVLEKGKFILWAKEQAISPEGYLFPDTYKFFLESKPEDVAKKMRDNFEVKAKPLLDQFPKSFSKNLILASLLEKEVPSFEDRQIVAGILLKRLSVGMPFQVDATVCYTKEMEGKTSCYPLEPLDFKEKSAYNTYVSRGLPPGPIGNPGEEAIKAAMSPIRTVYWYYLSDPKTGKTIWSEALDTQAANRAKYLKK